MTAEVRSTFHLRPYGLAASGAAASAARPYMHLCYTEKIDVLKRARLLCYLVLCVSRAVLSVVLGAWSVRFVGWADWVDCRFFLSFVFLALPGVWSFLRVTPVCDPTTLRQTLSQPFHLAPHLPLLPTPPHYHKEPHPMEPLTRP